MSVRHPLSYHYNKLTKSNRCHVIFCFSACFQMNFSSLSPHLEGQEVMLAFHSYYPTSSLTASPLPLVPSEEKQSEDHSCFNGGSSAATGLQNGGTLALQKGRLGIDDEQCASSNNAAMALPNRVTSACEKGRSGTDGEKSASSSRALAGLQKRLNSCEEGPDTDDEKCISSACEDDMYSNFSADNDNTPPEGAPTHCSKSGQGSVNRCNVKCASSVVELDGVDSTLDVNDASTETNLVATKNGVTGAGATGGWLTPRPWTAPNTVGSSSDSLLPGS